MAVNNDVKSLGLLMLVLLALVIIVGTIYVVADKYKETLCTTADSTYVWSDAACENSTGSSVSVESITKVNIVLTAIGTVLGFLAVIVIVAIARIIVRMTQGMAGGNM